MLSSIKNKVWIFQANPDPQAEYAYDILNAMNDPRLQKDVWRVNQHRDEIRKGDTVLIWVSGNIEQRGIYALADIISEQGNMFEPPAAAQYHFHEENRNQKIWGVEYKLRKRIIPPILVIDLRRIHGLENLSILRNPRGTNFPVTSEEWEKISELIKMHTIFLIK